MTEWRRDPAAIPGVGAGADSQKEDDMMQSLLVPLDGTSYSEQSLPLAAALAQATHATVHLAHVHVPHAPEHFLSNTQFHYEGLDLDAYEARYQQKEQAYLLRVAERVEATANSPVDTTVLEGSVAQTLEAYAEHVDADLILIATHGREGTRRLWGGSLADALIRDTTLPVLLVHPPAEKTGVELLPSFEHVLVPLDGSENGERILEIVKDVAVATGSRVTLLNVLPYNTIAGSRLFPLMPEDVAAALDNARSYLDNVADALRDGGLRVTTHVAEGEAPARAIVETAERIGADLIALSTHGYGRIKRVLLGSVASEVLRRTCLPILTQRAWTQEE